MAAITIRNLPEETHRALKARAAVHGRSTEAEVREILNQSVSDRCREGLGTRMARIAAEVGGFDLDLARSGAPSEPIDFT